MELHVLPKANGAAQNLSSIRITEQFDNPKGDDNIVEVPIDGMNIHQSTEVSIPEPGEKTRRSQHRSREYVQLAALYYCLFRMRTSLQSSNLFTETVW